MTRFVPLLLAGVLSCTPAVAQAPNQVPNFGGGPIAPGPMDYNEAQIDAAHRESVARAQSLGLDRRQTPQVNSTGNLLFPLKLSPGSKAFRGNGISNFVDLNPSGTLKDFACGTRTYDGHRGIDLSLYPHLWRMMDAAEMEIVAAAPGVIVNKNDGAYDRQCARNSDPANFVTILQDDGLYAFYWHMKTGSVTSAPVGQRVAAGHALGLVGSSGSSTGPHLHFELRRQDGVTVDPFAGTCGAKTTRWKHQPENVDTDILRIATHSVTPPSAWSGCSNPDPKYASRFNSGANVWGAVYLRDQRPNTPLVLSFIRPSGQVFASWTTGPIPNVYAYSYWWGSITLPTTGAVGVWKVRAKLEGRTMERAFVVGAMPAATSLQLSVTPATRTITPDQTAIFTVTVKNAGTRTAVGCNVTPDVPLAAVWNVQQIVPAVPAGEFNRAFDLAGAATKTFRLLIKPKTGYRAAAIKIPIRAACLNANSPAGAGAKSVTLSF